MTEKLETGVYQRSDGKWAYRIVDESNGQIIGTDGNQGYERRIDAQRALTHVLNLEPEGAPDTPGE